MLLLKQRYCLNHEYNRLVRPDLWLLNANYSIKISSVVLPGNLLSEHFFHPYSKAAKFLEPLRNFSKITTRPVRTTLRIISSYTWTAASCQRRSTSTKLKINMLLFILVNAVTKTSFPWVDPETLKSKEKRRQEKRQEKKKEEKINEKQTIQCAC